MGPSLKEAWGPSGWARQVRVTPGAKSPETRARGGAVDAERTPEKERGKTGCRAEDAGSILARGSELPQQPSAGHGLGRGWGQRRGHGREAAPVWAELAVPHCPESSAEARRGDALRRPESPVAGVRVLEPLGRRWAHGSSPGDRPWHGDADPSHMRSPATTNISPGDFLQDGEKGPKVPLS